MTDFKLSAEERETVLRINDLPGATWDAWTFSERWARKLTRAGYDVTKDHQGGWSCKIPRDRIKIMRPEKRKVGFALSRKRRSDSSEAHVHADIAGQNPSAIV